MGVNSTALEAIKNCYNGTRKSLEGILSREGLDSVNARSDAILEAMGIGKDGEIYYSGDTEEPCSDEERYEALVGTFFSGVWLPGAV